MDLDIDAVTLLGSEFDENGKYVIWSPLADISSIERLEASQELPFPTSQETEIQINNYRDSFFTTYDEQIRDVFAVEYDEKGILLNKEGFPILKIKDNNPETLRKLALFLEDVEATGLYMRGDTKSDGSWRKTDQSQAEWDNVITLEDGRQVSRQNALKDLGFPTVESAYNVLTQIKELVDSHNTYLSTVDDRTRQLMTKNQCQWAMYLICSTPSNLVELMVGVDVATDPIKNKKNGAVVLSPYNGDDKQAAFGNHYTVHRSFQEGQIGKLCVGIGAVSIKVNSTVLYYMDTLLKTGSKSDKERLLLPIVDSWGRRTTKPIKDEGNFYTIDGKRYYGMSNLYDKNSETEQEFTIETENGPVTFKCSRENTDKVIQLLASIQSPDDITPNVATSLAAMLSVAVDGTIKLDLQII